MDTLIPAILVTYFEYYSQCFSKPNYKYFCGFILSLLIVEGRRNVTKIAKICFFIDRHISSFEGFLHRNQWSLSKVKEATIKLLLRRFGDNLKIHGAYLIGVDTTYTQKTSSKMIGVQKWEEKKNGNKKLLDGHHWTIAGLICQLTKRFIFLPIIMRLISGKLNPYGFVAGKKGTRRMNFWDCTIACVSELAWLLDDTIRVVADAYFGKAPFINPLRQKKIELITRLRHDAVAWGLGVYCGRGRPPKRGKKHKLANLVKQFPLSKAKVNLYGSVKEVEFVCKDMFIRNVDFLVRIVVISAKKPIILISTDRTLTAGQIIELYGSRFSIEIGIRELKQHFGMGDYQSYVTIAFHRFVHLCCVGYCIFKSILIENPSWLSMKNHYVSESSLSFRKIRRTLRTFIIKKIIFSNSAKEAELEKLEDTFEKVFRIAA